MPVLRRMAHICRLPAPASRVRRFRLKRKIEGVDASCITASVDTIQGAMGARALLVAALLAQRASTVSSFVLLTSVGQHSGLRRCLELSAPAGSRSPAYSSSPLMQEEAAPHASSLVPRGTGGSRREVLERLTVAAVSLVTLPSVASADTCTRKECQVCQVCPPN